MPAARMPEALYDSATMLRLVDNELAELRDDPPLQAQVSGIVEILQHANGEIGQVLSTLRESREALQVASVQQIHRSADKLRDVSNATEHAATSILDGLDRAHALVNELERLEGSVADADSGAGHDPASVRGQLRDELFGMMGALQFQDITNQQLDYVATMLAEVDRRLLAIAGLLDGGHAHAAQIAATESAPRPAAQSTFTESASLRDGPARQAEADALFRITRPVARAGA